MDKDTTMQGGEDDRPEDRDRGSAPQVVVQPDEQPVCAACGGEITVDDLVCPHCGVSLAAG